MLRPTDFENVRTPHSPYPHQEEAIAQILATFKTHDRANVMMACGTGKTHVCLWVAERLKAKRVAVFVPSLALISQLLHEWLADTSWPRVACMAICSDNTVTKGTDTFKLDPSECDFPVTTNALEVHQFLKNKKPVKQGIFGRQGIQSTHDSQSIQLIFCTYHSSKVLAAAMKGCEPFDLCIFDEAHKTTGAYDKSFAIALSDNNIPVRKRLFVTATPRHYDIHHQNTEGDAKLLYSMDSEAHYGPRAYTLSFRKAVNLGIISDYKVLVPVIVREHNKIRTHISGEKLDERAVALQKAAKNYNISKIITFHPRIRDAGEFTYYLNHTQQLHHFRCYHVNCKMSISSRRAAMDGFKTHKKTLISNAHCLTEGTNIPAVDMVVFFHQKRSRIDTLQAIGRVMRKHDNKDIGYVFLPLFVHAELGENVELAAHRAQYDQIWEVLQALAEQDEDLHQTIQSLRMDMGRGTELDFNKLSQFIEILPDEHLDANMQRALKKSIAIRMVDKISSPWDEMYGKLCAYREKYGHCRIPQHYSSDILLGHWVGKQRTLCNKENLSKDKMELLNKVGFIWNPFEIQWQENYQKLLTFKKQHGHTNVPNRYNNEKSLGPWVSAQRTLYNKSKLTNKKIELLDKTGFIWDILETQWQENYQKLLNFKKQHGHTNVLFKYDNDKTLGPWVSAQRTLYNKENLSKDKVALLNKVEFVWDMHETQWQENYQKLLNFKKQHGHTNVPFQYNNDNALGRWVSAQRTLYNKSKLTKDKMELLNKIGFIWNPIEILWQESYQKLLSFKKQHGHTNVPNRYNNEKSLGKWVGNQRALYNKSKLTKDKMELLNKIGFIWNPFEILWQENYQKLLSFKKQHGHTNVPNRYNNEKSLGKWVGNQRALYNKSKLTKDKMELLNKIGFIWNPFKTQWQANYQKLLNFKKQHGHTHVPHQYDNDKPLGLWVGTQRKLYNKSKLTKDKMELLNKIGFIWNPIEILWQESYQKLLDFKKQHGHTHVPHQYDNDKPLGLWVGTQRALYNKSKLTKDKMELLNKIGFIWNPIEILWQESYQKLLDFKKQHGHNHVKRHDNDETLRCWVASQRTLYNKAKLSKDKIELLNKIEFIWNPIETKWQENYQKLLNFKKQHGHTHVPHQYDNDKPLGLWVCKQKMNYKNDKLSKERIKKLKKIGFSFTTKGPD